MPTPRSNSQLIWGFKAQSERISIAFRKALGKQAHEPLLAQELAKHLNVLISSPEEIGLNKKDAYTLMKRDSGWSGMTFPDKKGKFIIAHNIYHSPGRQQSTLMHELAHIICEHKLPELEMIGGLSLPMRKYDVQQEAEAEWLGSNLQITRKGLEWVIGNQWTVKAIARYYKASEPMVLYRLNTSGLEL